jgi:hypothetical protein
LENLGIDERIILKWIIKKHFAKVWTGSSWLRIRSDSGSYYRANESSGFIQYGELLDQLTTSYTRRTLLNGDWRGENYGLDMVWKDQGFKICEK